jgi:hypothetical protein
VRTSAVRKLSAGERAIGPSGHRRPVLRLCVWLQGNSLDYRLARGADPAAGSALSLRARQLTTSRTRARIADALERALAAADEPPGPYSAAVPVKRDQVHAARWELVAVAERLRAPRPVWAQGVAAVSQLLANADSPLYQSGQDLREAAAAAIEMLDGVGTRAHQRWWS